LYKALPKFNDNSYAHFITTRTYENRPYFKDESLAHILLTEIKFYTQRYGFSLMGYVIMPDHLHLLMWWNKEEKPTLTVSRIMQGIKAGTAMRIVNLLKNRGLEHLLQPTHIREPQAPHTNNVDSKSHNRNLRYRLWQAGFYDFNVYSEAKLSEKLNYMHNNPVKAGLVYSTSDYKWSSYLEYYR
jgi:putative transposase